MTTGEKIRRLRTERGMTQEELGAEVGVQKAAINKYETGIVVNLKRDVIRRLARALEVNPMWLMDDEEGWPPVPHLKTLIDQGLQQKDAEFGKLVSEHYDAREIGELYLSLSPENRAATKKYMLYLKSQEEEKEE